MKTVYKILGVVCYVLAVLTALLGLIMISAKEVGIGIFFFVCVVIFVLLARYTKSYAAKKYGSAKPAPAPVPATAPEAPAPAPAPTPAAPAKPVEPKPTPKASPVEDCESYNFAVAGVRYHEDEIIEGLMDENPDYELTKKEIKEDGLEDTYLYKYDVAFVDVDFVSEPDNQYDPNAIKVVADGVLVGYVPAKKTKAVRKIMDEKKIIKSQCQIYGGDYKVLEYDSSSIRKGSTDLKAVVSIKYK